MKQLFSVTIRYTLADVYEGELIPVDIEKSYIYRAERPLDILKKITQGHVLGWKKQDNRCFMHPQRHQYSKKCENEGLGLESFWRLDITPASEVIIDA